MTPNQFDSQPTSRVERGLAIRREADSFDVDFRCVRITGDQGQGDRAAGFNALLGVVDHPGLGVIRLVTTDRHCSRLAEAIPLKSNEFSNPAQYQLLERLSIRHPEVVDSVWPLREVGTARINAGKWRGMDVKIMTWWEKMTAR